VQERNSDQKSVLKHVIGLIAALFVALVCFYLLDIRKADASEEQHLFSTLLSIFIGFLVEVGWLVLLDLLETKKARGESQREALRTQTILSDVQSRTSELIGRLGERIEHDENLHEVLRYARPNFRPDEMTENWLYLLNRLRDAYWATNYIDPHHIYATNWGKAAFLIQNAKRTETHVFMRKVFLIKEDAEMLVLSEHLEQQRQIGIDIHYLPYELVEKDPELSTWLRPDGIPSIDFGVFDEKLVLVWELDMATRLVKGGRVLFGRDQVERHKRFFRSLFSKAEEYCRDRFTLVQIEPKYMENMIRAVAAWPQYGPPYEEMDYALRLPKGWLTQFASKPGCVTYAAYADGTLVGFSLLVREGDDAEFYVAVHPRYLNIPEKRFGKRLTRSTLDKGLDELNLRRIHLKVRKSVLHRVQLYEKLGFRRCGETTEVVNGISTDFIKMEMTR
jgi:RimJ/RimL family protein N-acetyltransferase